MHAAAAAAAAAAAVERPKEGKRDRGEWPAHKKCEEEERVEEGGEKWGRMAKECQFFAPFLND